jgi:Protein of unknown function (DUF3285)
MSSPPSPENPQAIYSTEALSAETEVEATPSHSAKPSYVKLAMRNMVRQGSKSLFHFTLTLIGLIGLLVALAYLTR